ncbi:MAG: hypothetical protein V1822_00090 [Candidatus Micrarchaeota archaeon]
MDIPNPYSGNYKLLAVLPITLVIISIILVAFVSPIKMGIDFKGGIEVAIPIAQPIGLSLFRSTLEGEGYSIDTLEQNQRPSDYIIQAELARPKAVIDSDALNQKYFSMRSNVSELEAQTVYSNSSTAMQDYKSARVELDGIANSLFALAGFEQNASAYSSTHTLTNQVQQARVSIRDKENTALLKALKTAAPGALTEPDIKERTATLAEDFLGRAFMVVLYSVILTSIVVFLIFRTAVPSAAVLAGAGADVIFALGAMSIFGIPLTLASFSALLMLVGFSLDTDILLTMRVIKRREGTAAQRAYDSMKTGITMSSSIMVAFLALFALALITHEALYYQISAVVIAGLIGDVIATWAFNAVILLAHAQDMERKGKTFVQRSFLSYIFRN